MNGKTILADEDYQPLVILTVPHSGTHYLRNALADLDLPYATKWTDVGEDGLVGHFYTLGKTIHQTALLDNDVPILTPLRDPMAIALSTWRSAEESKNPTEKAWHALKKNLVESWALQQKYWERLTPVPIEWIVQAPAPSFPFKHLLPVWEREDTQFRPHAAKEDRDYEYKGIQSGTWLKNNLPLVYDLMCGEDFFHHCTPYQAHYPFWWVREPMELSR